MKETTISVFRDLFQPKEVPYSVSLEKIVSRLKDDTGRTKSIVDKVRSAKNDEEKSTHKKKLPCICFAGTFSERKKSGLLEHKGLMVVDFDKYPDKETMLKDKDSLKKNEHVLMLFVSPSGKGLKAVIKIPVCDSNKHEQIFNNFESYIDNPYFDTSNSNVDRVCFESYDPDVFVNWDAKEYSPVIIDKGYDVKDKIPLLPVNDDEKKIERIMKFNWGKDFVEGERNSYIFDIAGAFCEYGVSEYMAQGYILNNIVIGGFSEKEAERTIKSAYKTRSFNIKYFEDYDKIKHIKSDLKKGEDIVLSKHNIDKDTYDEIKETIDSQDFWFFDKNKKVKIDSFLYKLFLENNGFKKYYPDGADKPNLVRVVSNKVSETSTEKIKDFVLNYLLDKKELDVWNYCASYLNLFSENYLQMLDTINLMMLKDTRNKSYIVYQNGILEVSKDSTKLIDYIDVDGYIWENQIINRNFLFSEDKENDYKKFINNIASNEPYPMEAVIGYLLCNYKNKMNNKAIILNDETITDNPEGGTGKGLFVQGIKQIRRVSILDGKSFDDKKSFPYQTVSQDTNVLVFDDVKKNFDFESKFSLVTEGMTLERKNKDALKLSVEDSPKLVISTNYAIKGEGNSHDRRRHEVEFAQYYGKNKTPYDEMGRELFDDWDQDEFLRFDNYMVFCLQTYLKDGLIKQNAKNLKQRKFIAETSFEFYEWMTTDGNITFGNRITKTLAFSSFIEEYQDYKKWLTRKRFSIWVQKYADFVGLEYKDGNTNGERWFSISELNFKQDESDDTPF